MKKTAILLFLLIAPLSPTGAKEPELPSKKALPEEYHLPELPALPEYATGDNVPVPHESPWDNDASLLPSILPELGEIEGAGKFLEEGKESFWEEEKSGETLFFKVNREVLLENKIEEKGAETYLKVVIDNKEIRISPLFEGQGWESYEILNKENAWSTVVKNGIDIKSAVPCLQGFSLTPEKIASIKLTPSAIQFFRQDGKEGARYLSGGRIHPDTVAKIQAWKNRAVLLEKSTDHAVITVDLSLRGQREEEEVKTQK